MRQKNNAPETIRDLFEGVSIENLPKTVGSQTYGELIPESVTKLLSNIKPTENDHILDLGSGIGKLVIQCCLEADFGSVTGIEIVPECYKLAISLSEKVRPQLKGKQLYLLEGDFLAPSWIPYNILYTCSTCFPTALIDEITQKVNHNPHLEKVFSFKPLGPLKYLRYTGTITLEATWDTILCYIYHQK